MNVLLENVEAHLEKIDTRERSGEQRAAVIGALEGNDALLVRASRPIEVILDESDRRLVGYGAARTKVGVVDM